MFVLSVTVYEIFMYELPNVFDLDFDLESDVDDLVVNLRMNLFCYHTYLCQTGASRTSRLCSLNDCDCDSKANFLHTIII